MYIPALSETGLKSRLLIQTKTVRRHPVGDVCSVTTPTDEDHEEKNNKIHPHLMFDQLKIYCRFAGYQKQNPGAAAHRCGQMCDGVGVRYSR